MTAAATEEEEEAVTETPCRVCSALLLPRKRVKSPRPSLYRACTPTYRAQG